MATKDKEFLITGVAGAGKTTYAMRIIEKALRPVSQGGGGLKWQNIAFCSFTTRASDVAARRAAVVTGMPVEMLTKSGWFRTLHSTALRCLGSGFAVFDGKNKKSKEFLTHVFGYLPDPKVEGTLAWHLYEALQLWDRKRAKLQRFCENNVGNGVSYPLGSDMGTTEEPLGHRNPAFYKENVSYPSHTTFATDGSDSELLPRCDLGVSTVRLLPVCPPIAELSVVPSQTPVVPLSYPQGSDTFVNARYDDDAFFEPVVPISSREEKIYSSLAYTSARDRTIADRWFPLVVQYEKAKLLHGMIDFGDMLLKFAGMNVTDELDFRLGHPEGSVPDEIEMVIIDEGQDNSRLLGLAVDRLARGSHRLYRLGDPLQAIFGWAGGDGASFAKQERLAIDSGNHVLLNRSYRNPPEVIAWGEAVLEESDEYESREPFTECDNGTVGMIEWDRFAAGMRSYVNSDVMIIGRHNGPTCLGKVKSILDSLAIPWASTDEKKPSKWQSMTVKIPIVIAFMELIQGREISRTQWRLITKNFTQKQNDGLIYKTGTKTAAESFRGETPEKTIDQLRDWGATELFSVFVRTEQWKQNDFLLINHAIENYGLKAVLAPRIRIGTVHSVKGDEAENVFCLMYNNEFFANADADEERNLKYVAITRAKRNYRLVIDYNHITAAKPMFWAAPKNGNKFYCDKTPIELGVVVDVVETAVEDDFVSAGHRAAAAGVEPVGDEYDWFDL